MENKFPNENFEDQKVVNAKSDHKLHKFTSKLPNDKKRLIVLCLIVLAIPLTVGLALVSQEMRSRASEYPVTPPGPNTFGQALSITSSGNAYARAVNSGSIGNFDNLTIEALVNYVPTSDNLYYPIVAKKWNINAGESMPFNFQITKDGHLNFIYTIMYQGRWAHTEITSKNILSPNVFHHVAVVYNSIPYSGANTDGGRLSLFIDGVRDTYVLQSGLIAGGSNGDVTIGYSNSTKFNGEIDEVRITNNPRYLGDKPYAQIEPFTNDPGTLLLYKFDNNIYDSSGNYNGTAESGVVSYAQSTNSPFVYPATDHFTLTPSEENITMPVSSPNSSYGIYAILKNNGEVVKDQSSYEYHWLSGDLVALQPFSACTNGIVDPCPQDHASLTAKKVGNTIITLVVAKKGATGCNDSNCIARVNFNVNVVEGPTPTALPTNTPTPTKIPTPTVTKIPTPTPTPAPLKLTLNPAADAFVRSTAPNQNFGTNTNLRIDSSPVEIAYLKFNLAPLAGKTIKSAKLRIKVSDATSQVLNLRRGTTASWTETGITYNSRPTFEAVITSFNATTLNEIKELTVTNVVNLRKGGNLTLGISSAGDDIGAFYSRESANKPQLVVEYQ